MSVRVAAIVESAWHRVPGGVANATHHSVHAAAADPEIDVVGVRALHRRGPAPGLEPLVPTVAIPLPRPALYDLWHRVRRPRLDRWVDEVDVVHAPTAVIPPAGSAALVATIHDLAFLRSPERSTTRGVKLANRGLELARDEATIITVPSAATRDECIEAGIDAPRIRVIPWGCEPTEVTDAERGRVRAAYGIPDRFILWVGTLEPRKNLGGLIAAHHALSEVPLLVVGPDGWGDMPAAPASTVRRIGPVPARDLPVLYDLATVFAFPSHAEGFGMPVLEAMAQGTPVVTSSGTATEEVVGDAGITVAPTERDALAEALTGLLADDDEQARLGEAGRRRAAAFTWSRTGELLASAYREAVA